MFPGIYDFRWDAGHIIFLGAFYAVLATVVSMFALALVRTIRDFRRGRASSLIWHADFADLPAADRRCRHELMGEVDERVCENGFDCRRCAEHPKFIAARTAAKLSTTELEPRVGGFALPSDRLYHRGHTWVRQEEDGTMTVGVDDLARHLVGDRMDVIPPSVGARLVANGAGWAVRKDGHRIRVLSPVDGEVVAIGGPDDDWVLRLRPVGESDTRHLLSFEEARVWMLREVEKLHAALAVDGLGATLADGGLPIEDLSDAIPTRRMEDVVGQVFLEP